MFDYKDLPDVISLVIDGQKTHDNKHKEAETKKVGTLRGGSVGALKEDGTYYESCAAKVWLRYKGIDISPTDTSFLDYGSAGSLPEKSLMFAAGLTNEDSWLKLLEDSWTTKGKGYEVRTEEEMPVKYTLKDSEINVTGRPDIGLFKDGKLKLGLELKLVCSMWTARDILFEQKPKMSHLLQAAHYSWKSGAPFDLYYTNRVNYHIGNLATLFPPIDGPMSQFIDWTYYRLGLINKKTGRRIEHRSTEEEYYTLPFEDRKRKPLKVIPFVCGYRVILDGDSGQISYQPLWQGSHGEVVHTHLGLGDIERFYESIPGLRKVPAMPILLKSDGSKVNYTPDKYCSLGELCCKFKKGKDIDKWKEQVELFINNKSK